MAEAVPTLSLVIPSDEEDRAPALRLSPFGEGQITLGDQRISNSALPPKAREALFYAARSQGSASRDHLLEALWEDAPDGSRELWDATRHIRRMLGKQSWTIRLGVYSISLPLVDKGKLFQEAAGRVLSKEPAMDRLEAGEQAVDLLGAGGYLEWCESIWVAEERVRTQRMAVDTCLALASLYVELNRIDDAVAACKRAIGLEPLEEAPRLALIRLLAGRGRMVAARQEYQEYRALAREELGTEPSPTLRRLVAKLSGA